MRSSLKILPKSTNELIQNALNFNYFLSTLKRRKSSFIWIFIVLILSFYIYKVLNKKS